MAGDKTSTRIAVTVNLDVESPVAGTLGPERMPGGKDVMYSKYSDGQSYAETRPAVAAYDHGPDAAPVGGARGIFYWEAASTLLIAYRDSVHEGQYGPIAATFPLGKEPVYWAEFSGHTTTQDAVLVMSDPEGNTVTKFTWNGISITSDNLTTQLPSELTDEGIAGGVVALDNYLFLLSEAGKIYNCTVNQIDVWDGGNFITTERAVDPGVFLAKQQEHIVAISSSSIEVFYDAANPVGSPLKRRNDVSFLVGALDHKKVHTNGEKIFFIGSSLLGSFSVYLLERLQLQQVSYQGLDAWVADTLITYNKEFIITSGTLGEHYFLYMTSVTPDDVNHLYVPINTAVFDTTSKLWTRFKTKVTELEGYGESFPLMAITERLGKDAGGQTLLMLNGTLARYELESKGADVFTTFGAYVTEDGELESPNEYWDEGYVVSFGADIVWPINPHIVTEEWDGGIYTNKFISRMAVVGRSRPKVRDTGGNIVISYTDDTFETWSQNRYTPAHKKWMYTRMGKTKRRAFFVGYEGLDHVRFEAVEIGLGGSQWA